MEILGDFGTELTAKSGNCIPSNCRYQCWCISGGPEYNSYVSCRDNISRFY